MDDYVLIVLAVLGVVALIGIFRTKTPGFGRYSTSVLLLTLVLFVSALFLVAGKLDAPVFANIVFAITGFAGGLITGRDKDAQPSAAGNAPQAGRP